MADGGAWLINAVINHFMRGVAQPATKAYLAIHTGDPGSNGTANEVSTTGTGYARQMVGDYLDAPASGISANNTLIRIGPALINIGTITWITLWTAATGGNFLGRKQLSIPQTLNQNGYFEFDVGQLTTAES